MSLLRTAGHMAVASSVHGRVQRRQQQRWQGQAQQQAANASAEPAAAAPPAAAPPPPPPAPAPELSMDDKLAQLAKLGELRDAGILTDVEFAVQKDRILRG